MNMSSLKLLYPYFSLPLISFKLKQKIAEKETSGSVTIDTTASPGDSAHTSSNNRTLPLCEIGRQRVILLGRELKDNQVLNSLNISDDKVVQIYMRATPTVS